MQRQKANSQASSPTPPDAIEQSLCLQSGDSVPKPIEIFIVCSQEEQDLRLRTKLQQGLSPLSRAGVITIWHEDMIVPGADHQQEVDIHFDQSAFILFLLSQDFFASEACHHIVQKIMAKQGKTVIPIIFRHCDWEETFKTIEVLPSNRAPITSWSDVDQAFLEVIKGIRSAITERLPAHPADVLSARDTNLMGHNKILPSQWNVPYQRNLFFTGRESVLVSLHEMLHTPKRAALTQALTGLGGIGKTQAAIEYVYRYQHEYTAILWAKADSHEALIASYTTIADTLDVAVRDEQDQHRLIQAVKKWFNTHTHWILILDGVEDIEMLSEYLPQGSGGHIVLTTRTQSLGTVANTIEIEKMKIIEGTLFLLRRAKAIRLDDSLDMVPDTEQEEAREISEMMDGLPLALDQAGAYIEETKCSFARYLELYKQRRAQLLKKRGRTVSGHAESVTTTFLLCFEKVAHINGAATELLRCCALLHPDDIPEEIFTEGAVELGSVLQPIAADPFLLDEAIADLSHYSLIHRNAETNMLSIHHLVQAVLVDEMGEQLQHIWAERVVKVLCKVFPGRRSTTWQQIQRYLTHAQVCMLLIEKWEMQSIDIAHWLSHVGHFLTKSGFYTLAEQFLVQSNTLVKNDLSDIIEALFGTQWANYVRSSPVMETITSMSLLPQLYLQQGKYDQAELHIQQAIAFIEQFRGPNDTNLIKPLDILGALYSTTGKYTEAEALYQRSLNIRLRGSTADVSELASSLNNLADLYRKQGKYDQAEPLYQEALQMSETRFGPNHIGVAHILHNMALLYRAQKKYSQAETLYQRALSLYEHAYGPESPYLANVINSLGALYTYQDEDTKAEPLLLRALAIREKVLGLEHADVGRTLNNLGNLYLRKGKYDQALQALQRSLQIYTQSLGTEHIETAMALTNLGNLYIEQHNYVQAEASLEQAFAIYEQAVGLQSPDAIAIFQALVVVYAHQKKYLQLQMVCQRMLPVLKERLGTHHEEVQSVQNMILVLSQKGWHQASAVQKSRSRTSRPKHNKKRRKK